MRKVKYLLLLLLFHLIVGCGTPAEYRKAQESLAEGNFIEALKYYEITLEKASMPSDREIIQQNISQTKRKLADNSLNEAETAYNESISPTIQSIDKALSILQASSAYDDDRSRISKKIKDYRSEKDTMLTSIQSLINDADKLAGEGKYFNAREKLYKAQKMDSTNRPLSDKLSKLENISQRQKKSYIEQIDNFLSKGNGREAKDTYDKLVLIDPDHPNLENLKKEILDAYHKQIMSDIGSLENEKKWFKAYEAIKKSNLNDLDQETARIRSTGSEYYYNKAETHFNSGELSLAYIAALKARELDPNELRSFQMHKKCEDSIEKEIQKFIAIPTFDSPVNDPDAGKWFSDVLISRLFRVLPYGINIVEREKIDLLMNEKKMELKNIGNLLGVDMIITGNVSILKVDSNKSEIMATTRIKIGEEEKPNPVFSQMLSTYGNNLEMWPYKPPMTTKEDKFEIVKYKKGQVSLKAFVNSSIRIFDTKKATIVFAKDFQDSISKTDEFQESVEAANISEDPLELPTETEIKRDLQNKVIEQIIDVILATFENREERFLKWAAYHIERKEYQEALNFLAQGHLYSKRAKRSNQYTDEIYNLLVNLTEGE